MTGTFPVPFLFQIFLRLKKFGNFLHMKNSLALAVLFFFIFNEPNCALDE